MLLNAVQPEHTRAVADEDEAIRLGAESTVIERAADRAAGAGDWKRAAALLTRLARNPDTPMETRCLLPVACLRAGDTKGYRAACAGIAAQLPRGDPKRSHHDSNFAARATVLGPNATDNWTRALAWSDLALGRLVEIEKARPQLKELIRRERLTDDGGAKQLANSLAFGQRKRTPFWRMIGDLMWIVSQGGKDGGMHTCFG